MLTSSEVGKQLRGVVSYLDGYGTNEAVKSDTVIVEPIITAFEQQLTLTSPSKATIRHGISSQSSIFYDVSTGDTNLTGVGIKLFYDSSQVTPSLINEPFQGNLIGINTIADTTDDDGDPNTDKALTLAYASFDSQFPGTEISLPLTIADLELVPTDGFTGTTLHLTGTGASGYDIIGSDLILGYNAAPTLTQALGRVEVIRGTELSYSLPTDLFVDPDSDLEITISAREGENLPSWLSYDASTQTFSGTPFEGELSEILITASDELGSISSVLEIHALELQTIGSSSASIFYVNEQPVTLPILYSSSSKDPTTGISFNIHFDSSLLELIGLSEQVEADLSSVSDVFLDHDNLDGDAATDSYITVSVSSFDGSFGSESTDNKLLIGNLQFAINESGLDPITGYPSTAINFTEQESAPGYAFASSSTFLNPLDFNLDVDGSGGVSALGDGIMVIRKLFGQTFSGDLLTNKAIDPVDATRDTSEIHHYLQSAIDYGLLDVDKDGQATALGDGLMIVRHLFGSFSGDALISKAISPDSPYYGQDNAWEMVAANIDALIP